jgi:hypothetical protein
MASKVAAERVHGRQAAVSAADGVDHAVASGCPSSATSLTIDRTFHRVIRVVYRVEFEGCAPIEFDRLGEARARSAEPPPEPQAGAAPESSGNEAVQPAADSVGPPEPETTEAASSDPAQVRY